MTKVASPPKFLNLYDPSCTRCKGSGRYIIPICSDTETKSTVIEIIECNCHKEFKFKIIPIKVDEQYHFKQHYIPQTVKIAHLTETEKEHMNEFWSHIYPDDYEM